MGRALQLYDETRIDHFRGFAGYWSVDAKAETAMVRGPGAAACAGRLACLCCCWPAAGLPLAAQTAPG
jgi:hypothetical protein